MAQFGFTFDSLKCIGCSACAVACKAEMNPPLGVRYRRVLDVESGTFAGVGPNETQRAFTTMACFHCAKPACVGACPTGAAYKEVDFGIVLIDESLCVGCRRCAAACPYGAVQFNLELSKSEKCLACWHRIVDDSVNPPVLRPNVRPACVAGCPARALGSKVKASWASGNEPAGFYDRTVTGPSAEFP